MEPAAEEQRQTAAGPQASPEDPPVSEVADLEGAGAEDPAGAN